MYYKEVKNESERSTPYPNHVPVRRSAQLELVRVPGLLSPHSPAIRWAISPSEYLSSPAPASPFRRSRRGRP